MWFSSVLHKADGGRLFTEALAAQVETILADETGLMSAEAALAGSLAKLTRSGKPDGVVGHFGWVGGLHKHPVYLKDQR